MKLRNTYPVHNLGLEASSLGMLALLQELGAALGLTARITHGC